MIDELYQLFDRQLRAVEALEGRLRSLELVVAADERRFVATALDDMESASETLAALELTRVMALDAAGMSPDITARDLVAGIDDPGDRELLSAQLERLRAATERLEASRDRARVVVGRQSTQLRSRIEVAERLVAV